MQLTLGCEQNAAMAMPSENNSPYLPNLHIPPISPISRSRRRKATLTISSEIARSRMSALSKTRWIASPRGLAMWNLRP
jgi:hypothetical protein